MPGFLQIFPVRFPSGKPQPAANPQDIASADENTTEAECRDSIPRRYNNGIATFHLRRRDCDLVGVLEKLRMNTDAEAQGVSNEGCWGLRLR